MMEDFHLFNNCAFSRFTSTYIDEHKNKISESKLSLNWSYVNTKLISHDLFHVISSSQPIGHGSCFIGGPSGIAMGGGGKKTSLCGKCDAIFSYIYTNTTNLVFHLSYLVCLD